MAMNEDDCRMRRRSAAELLLGIKHVAINILMQHKEFKSGLRIKMRKRRSIENSWRQCLEAVEGGNLALHYLSEHGIDGLEQEYDDGK
ncbi:hypothetical protein AB2713_18910 [Citrobacter werkmanii]|uniref:hypothetical protein n=1 Tax=Citrobacter werkmanii TaxID=67827 RepID=UPI003463B171